MPKRPTHGCGGIVFHVMNRGARRLTLFDSPSDYAAFLRVLREAAERRPMRLLDFAVMHTHWHLVVWPVDDRDLSRYMHWLTVTHAQRWHLARGSGGTGAVYQGRFKAIPVQSDGHFLRLCRYVERNPVRGRLVARAEEWPWSSACPTRHAEAPPLDAWPVARPANWSDLVNRPESPYGLERLRECVRRGVPFGGSRWQVDTAVRIGWDARLRGRGRPLKENARAGEGVLSRFP